MRHLLAILLTVVAAGASASDYPTDPEQMDKLCQIIRAGPYFSVPPLDRLWFKDHCTCEKPVGCGFAGSKRFEARQAEAARAASQRTAPAVEQPGR